MLSYSYIILFIIFEFCSILMVQLQSNWQHDGFEVSDRSTKYLKIGNSKVFNSEGYLLSKKD